MTKAFGLVTNTFSNAGTSNEVYDEMGPQDGEQYRHVSVVQPLACPDLKCLKTINSISSEWLVGDACYEANCKQRAMGITAAAAGRSTLQWQPTLHQATLQSHLHALDNAAAQCHGNACCKLPLSPLLCVVCAGERGSSDHVSALLVGVDLLKKAVAARPSAFKGNKRLLLISSFDADTEVRRSRCMTPPW
jgi:hypothetical protein